MHTSTSSYIAPQLSRSAAQESRVAERCIALVILAAPRALRKNASLSLICFEHVQIRIALYISVLLHSAQCCTLAASLAQLEKSSPAPARTPPPPTLQHARQRLGLSTNAQNAPTVGLSVCRFVGSICRCPHQSRPRHVGRGLTLYVVTFQSLIAGCGWSLLN